MWIPRGLYEALPAAYVGLGALLLAVPFMTDVLPGTVLLMLGGVCVLAGLVLWMHRRSYRADQAEYDGRTSREE